MLNKPKALFLRNLYWSVILKLLYSRELNNHLEFYSEAPLFKSAKWTLTVHLQVMSPSNRLWNKKESKQSSLARSKKQKGKQTVKLGWDQGSSLAGSKDQV